MRKDIKEALKPIEDSNKKLDEAFENESEDQERLRDFNKNFKPNHKPHKTVTKPIPAKELIINFIKFGVSIIASLIVVYIAYKLGWNR